MMRRNVRDTSVYERSNAFSALDRLHFGRNYQWAGELVTLGICIGGDAGISMSIIGMSILIYLVAKRYEVVARIRPPIVKQ